MYFSNILEFVRISDVSILWRSIFNFAIIYLSIIIISVNSKTKKHFLFTCCILTCFLCFGFFRPSTDAYYISFIFAVQWIISFILSSFAEFPYNHVNKISRLDILGNIVSSIPFLVVFYWCITS